MRPLIPCLPSTPLLNLLLIPSPLSSRHSSPPNTIPMAPSTLMISLLLPLVIILTSLDPCMVSSRGLIKPSTGLIYHHGALLKGDIPVSILWYGNFTTNQKAILSDFLRSLNPNTHRFTSPPSVTQWWHKIDSLYISPAGPRSPKKARVVLATQVSDENCSIGKSLRRAQIAKLAGKAGTRRGGIAVVLTAEDVAVEGFCMSSCGFHGSDVKTRSAYIWVGNSATQCPGQCAWPFHQPIFGPQGPPLVAPNRDVGVDGMVINLASMVAGAVTNPFGNGYYQGPKEAPLEAATACAGVYGKGAYPGYAGTLLVDPATGASYNANGVNGRKYLLPALFDPVTSSCTTMV